MSPEVTGSVMLQTDSGILGDCPKFWPIRIPYSLLNDPMIDIVRAKAWVRDKSPGRVQDEKTRCGYIPSFTLFLFCCLCLCGLLTTSRMSGICILLCTGHRIKPGETDVRHMLQSHAKINLASCFLMLHRRTGWFSVSHAYSREEFRAPGIFNCNVIQKA